MWSWFEREVVDRDRLPVFVCLLAFVLTFLATRTITRLIRAGRGPFKDNVSPGGLHVHHAVPGVILLVTGAFTALIAELDSPWSIFAAICIGIGTSLVLDEFALILHLEDVYWQQEGQLSVEMVALAAASLGLVLIGANPFNLTDQEGIETSSVIASIIGVAVHLALVYICVRKRKYATALFGAFIPFLAAIGAVRLGRPGSRWFERRYGPAKQERAARRAERHDARWGPLRERITDFVAGAPTAVPGRAGERSEVT